MMLFIRTQANNVMLEATPETISALAEHYLPVSPTVPYIGPSKVTLVTIQFELTADLPVAIRKWEQLGFVRVNPCGETALADNVDRSGFPFEAAAIGASVVVSTAWPAPPQAVYLAPTSSQAREAGRTVRGYGSTKFELSAPPPVATSHLEPETCEAARILLDHTQDLQATMEKWENAGFVRLGAADAVMRNDLMGFRTSSLTRPSRWEQRWSQSRERRRSNAGSGAWMTGISTWMPYIRTRRYRYPRAGRR